MLLLEIAYTERRGYWSGRKHILKVNDTHAHSDTTPGLTYPNRCPTSCRTNSHFVYWKCL